MKIRPLGAELFHAGKRADGRTDMKKLVDAFHNFVKAPKNWLDIDFQKGKTDQLNFKDLKPSKYLNITISHKKYCITITMTK